MRTVEPPNVHLAAGLGGGGGGGGSCPVLGTCDKESCANRRVGSDQGGDVGEATSGMTGDVKANERRISAGPSSRSGCQSARAA